MGIPRPTRDLAILQYHRQGQLIPGRGLGERLAQGVILPSGAEIRLRAEPRPLAEPHPLVEPRPLVEQRPWGLEIRQKLEEVFQKLEAIHLKPVGVPLNQGMMLVKKQPKRGAILPKLEATYPRW